MNVLRSLSHRPFALLWAGQTISRLGDSLYRIALVWTHTLQEMVPGEILRRVYSIDALGSFVLLPIGFSLAGWATDLAGAPMVFLIGSLGTMTLAVLALFHPAIRNLD